jgi:hypothetical protein
MTKTQAERTAQVNDHKEFIALCKAYDTLEGEAKEKADADIAAYVVKFQSLLERPKTLHMSENEYEGWLERQYCSW